MVRSLIRAIGFQPKVLSFGKTQINLVFRSLIRTFGFLPKVLSFGKTQINLVFRSLIRTFVRYLLKTHINYTYYEALFVIHQRTVRLVRLRFGKRNRMAKGKDAS